MFGVLTDIVAAKPRRERGVGDEEGSEEDASMNHVMAGAGGESVLLRACLLHNYSSPHTHEGVAAQLSAAHYALRGHPRPVQ